MLTYRIDDMTCGRCASTITQAVRSVDAGAKVEVDLAQHLVRIEPTEAGAEALREAIADAGYTPAAVQVADAPAAPRASGCCCGSGRAACGS